MSNRVSLTKLISAACFGALAWCLCAGFGIASAGEQDRLCGLCHATPGLHMQLSSGELKSVYVEPQSYAASVHGPVLQCTACHADMGAYPHLGRAIEDVDSVPQRVRYAAACGQCHTEQHVAYLGSFHARTLTAGDPDAAICSDCHTAHAVQTADPQVVGLSLETAVYACSACHAQEFDEYRASAHGRALIDKGDPNVPACVDCHGAHTMDGASNAQFRAESPFLCASCHADADLMAKYDLSPHVLKTYVADFHGATLQLFPHVGADGTAPDEAVCYDCHGVHKIEYTSDPNSMVVRENLVTVCQQCHEGATENFPAAWVGHYEPTPQRNAPVFWTARFFLVLTLGVVCGMIWHISMDVLGAARNKFLEGKHADE